jgi:glycosyltransferase involved in cell wall biosynthesis
MDMPCAIPTVLFIGRHDQPIDPYGFHFKNKHSADNRSENSPCHYQQNRAWIGWHADPLDTALSAPATAESDIVVLPSLYEGLPLVLVEAMSYGVPFVATDAGGTGELGEDNPDVIVTSTKWEDFEAGLLAMAGKIHAGEINSRRLHEWVEKRYGYATVSQQWLQCLLNPQKFFNHHV